MEGSGSVQLVELRVLDGPNLYFTRPSIKLTMAVSGWLTLSEHRAAALASRIGAGSKSPPGGPWTDARRRFVARLASHATRELARSTGTSLAVRARVGPGPDQIVVAFPWRRRNAAEALGREVTLLFESALTARRPFARRDYSGFGGAARALAQPGVDVAVLETARGGILLRGIGTLHNDVAVVTNVSADHLDLHGIRTLDQLAEVKATITKITRPRGWDVLNADDPRVLAMRRGARGRPWVFSLDPDHPAIRSVLEDGGRATTVIDGRLTVLGPGGGSKALVVLEEVPLTLAGISMSNIQNAMAGASAALGIGLPEAPVTQGLKSFVLDEESNPGRANLYDLEGRIVVLDFAHNEAGMRGMVEICGGLRPPGGEIWLTFAAAGDRTNDILHGLGYTAARGADHVAVAELLHYLRGRDRQELVARLRAGAFDGGATDVPVFEDEMRALRSMLRSSRRGDVVAVAALVQRNEIFAYLRRRGAIRVGPKRVRQLVRRARGHR